MSRSVSRLGVMVNTLKLSSSATGVGIQVRDKHSLPNLPYDYKALEPAISGDIMQLHHQKHHQTYVTKLNEAEEKLQAGLQKGCVNTMIQLEPAIRFNGGGHLNHSIFWQNLSPNGGGTPSGALLEGIKHDFGSFDNFKKLMSDAAVAVQGSGWGWLGFNPVNRHLQVVITANQDPLFPTKGLKPLLGIDCWEHAYYLQYKNVRADYVKAIWDVINWKDVEKRYDEACSGSSK